MSLQYTEEEIEEFVCKLQQDITRNLRKYRTLLPIGFALGRVDPRGVRKRAAHIMYSGPVRDYTRLVHFSSRIQTMALQADAEVAGCAVLMPAAITESDEGSIQYNTSTATSLVRETVMIHTDQLHEGHKVWIAEVEMSGDVVEVTEFEELKVFPGPLNPNFLPVELYGMVTIEA